MDNQIAKNIENLKNNPLFQMSLGSKELFHSNILAWLMETNIKIAEKIFHDWKIIYSKQNLIDIKIERERYNIDLLVTVELTNKSKLLIVVENKLKSIPYPEQLDKYFEKINSLKEFNDINKKFILLSLTKPQFDLPGKWEFKGYSDLSDAISNINSSDFNNKLLHPINVILPIPKILEAYKSFIDKLVSLNDEVMQSKKYNYYCESNEVMKELRVIKIHDLFLKMAHQEISTQVIEEIGKIDQCLKNKRDQSSFKSIFDFSVYHGFTRSTDLTGLIILFYKNEKFNLVLGLQLQGNQFKYYTEMFPKIKSGMEGPIKQHILFAKELEKEQLWFKSNSINSKLKLDQDKDGNDKKGLGKGRSNSHEFCEYNKGLFLYHYDVLNNENNTLDIVDGFTKATEHVLKNKNQIIKIAETIFNDSK